MLYETISKQDLQAMENEYGFTPNYTYEDYVIVKNDDGEITEEYYTNLTVHKTANEVYEEWLESKNNPPTQEPIMAQLKAQLEVQENAINEQQNVINELLFEILPTLGGGEI